MTVWSDTNAAIRGQDPRSLISRGPRTGFVENTIAAWEANRAVNLSISRTRNMRDAYDPILKQLNAEGGQFVNPFGKSENEAPLTLETAAITGAAAAESFARAGGTDRRPRGRQAEEAIWSEVARRRAADPTALSGIPKSAGALIEDVNGEVRQKQEDAAEIASRARGGGALAGVFVGAAGALLTDPVNLLTLPFGATASAGILRTAMLESSIAAGVETTIQPAVQAYRRDVGLDYGALQATENVLMAATGAGIFAGSLRALQKGISRFATRRDLMKTFDETVTDPTKEQAAARADLENEDVFESMNPGPDTPEGRATHNDRLVDIEETMEAGGPVPGGEPLPPRLDAEIGLDPAGTRSRAATDAVEADLFGDQAAGLVLPDRIPVGVEISADGVVRPITRSASDIRAAIEADDAFVAAVEACR
ncbi:MAG: hypothetical protein V3W41_22410 [Planctomycetota bacterium]